MVLSGAPGGSIDLSPCARAAGTAAGGVPLAAFGRVCSGVLVQINRKTELADFVCRTLSALSRRQHGIPNGGRTCTLETQPAEIELSLVDPVQQFDPGDCDRCGLKPLTHWSVIKPTFWLVLFRYVCYQHGMKRDGRSFDHRTLEAIRKMAVERVRDGGRPSTVIASYGFNRTTIYKWLTTASQPGKGLKALRSRPASGRPRSLTPCQEQQVFRWINGRDPRQYGFDFGLWTRLIVALLIEQKFGIRLGVTAVGALLARLGLTPQKPLQRAYQRDPEAIERWQREQFPEIVKQAKASGGDIYFWDESGFRADTVHGKTWAKRGETPVIERPGQRQSISAASAVNPRGAFWYCTYEGGLNAELFVKLLKKLLRAAQSRCIWWWTDFRHTRRSS
jgi:transposase